MPRRPIAAQEDDIIGVFPGQLPQEEVRPVSVTVRQHQEEIIPADGIRCAVGVAVLPDVVAGDEGADALFAPAVFRLANPSEKTTI